MRIVGGSVRGRPLKGPKGPGIRPTADRVRETLFNVLGQSFEGGEVLDLFAGTGAFALEALSRGMTRAVLVDSGREALGLIRENTAALGFTGQAEVLAGDALKTVERLGREGRSFGLIFADPPYAQKTIADLLAGIVRAKLLKPEGTLLVEHGKHEPVPEHEGPLAQVDQRAFGETRVTLYRFLDPS
jgi:16S rRNA (guanine(966)-N(2))-methyltransferase RsmD